MFACGSLCLAVLVVLSVQSLTGEKDSRGGRAGGGVSWQNVKKMIYVKYNPKTSMAAGHWPIPESFWPDMNTKKLVQRPAHKHVFVHMSTCVCTFPPIIHSQPARCSSPVVWFRDKDVHPMLIESFPFDKYELEPSPLTQHILAKKNPNMCWQVSAC